MSKKYLFRDLYNRKRGESLPVDTNENIERSVKNALKCEPLDNLLVKVREKRWYGDIRVYDQKGIQVCEMTVSRGIIPKMKLARIEGFPLTPPYVPLWIPSVLNDKVEMKKHDERDLHCKEQEA